MIRRTTILLAILPLALILSACGTTSNAANPAQQQRLVSVTGNGSVMLTPDVAYINIGVHTEMTSASEAVSANNAQTQKVIDALKNSGVEAKDIHTTNFSIYPNAQYDPQTNQKTGTTYVVDNSVNVTVRDLSKLGATLDATVSAGANSVNSIQFDLADKTEALKQARDEAVKDAQTQAKELAAAAGISLGPVQSVNFYNSVPTPTAMALGKGGGGGAEAAVPIQSGQLTLTVTVNMSYEIR
jgi:uncharacterized protein YggE